MTQVFVSSPVKAIVIGTSAGAVETLSQLLPGIPKSFPVPIFIVVHVPADKKSVLAELFASKCSLKVKEAEDKEPIEKGTIYFAAPDYHLLIEPNGSLSLSSEEEVHFSRPAIDVLFECAADVYRECLVGIILTGANSDGAAGLRRVHDCGGRTIVQNPDLAISSTMPRAALAACPEATAMNLEDLAKFLCDLGTNS